MSKIISIITLSFLAVCAQAQTTGEATIRLTDTTLMHEMRATPSPLNGAAVGDRTVSFQWPLPASLNALRSGLDGAEEEVPKKKIDKSKLRYSLRYSPSPAFGQATTVQVETRWPFFNPEQDLAPGTWYWQYGYVTDGKTEWSDTLQFTVEANPHKFCPPALQAVLKNLPAHHPRVWLDKDEWESFMKRSEGKPERKTYIARADKVLATPMKSVNDINSDLAKGLANEVQKNAMLTRESRRIIDSEEANTDVLIRAYLLTKDRRYADEAIKRVKEMATWGDNKNVVGDFNEATLLSLCSMAYDALYDVLDDATRKFLLNEIKEFGSSMFLHDINRLENHIADNHVWQMTFRILTMAAFTVYGELPEAGAWTDYCYNLWLARFPGLNKDGGFLDTRMNVDKYWDEMVRYYSNIVGKYGSPVQKALAKLGGLPISTICSTHGPVWTENIAKVIGIYDRLSRYAAEEGVVIAYGSMYGNTEQMAEAIAAELSAQGIKNIVMHNVGKSNPSYIIADIFKYRGLIIGSPTYSNQIYPEIESLLSKILVREVKGRYLGYFGSFCWAGAAVKRMGEFAEKSKFEIVGDPVEMKQAMKDITYEQCENLARAMALRLKKGD